MNSPMQSTTFLFMWIGFLVLMIGCIAAFFLWAIRNGQFARQDRARYLPLQSGIPAADVPDEADRKDRGGKSATLTAGR
jgi:cbb3-type cytochrome oxidase maturation protein